MMAHMTAHFRGGPWADDSKFRSCQMPHAHKIEVAEILPVYSACGHYEMADQGVLTTEVLNELLVDVVYHWIDWTDADGNPLRSR